MAGATGALTEDTGISAYVIIRLYWHWLGLHADRSGRYASLEMAVRLSPEPLIVLSTCMTSSLASRY